MLNSLPETSCPDQPLIDFLNKVHAVESPRLAIGSEASLVDYRVQVHNLQRFFSAQCVKTGYKRRPVRLSDINSALLGGAMRWQIENKLSPATANKLRQTILAIYNAALDRGFAGKLVRVKKFRIQRRAPEAWLLPEVVKLLATAADFGGRCGPVPAGEWFRALLLFLFNTGTRIDAAMRTPTAGLDLVGGFVVIPAAVQKHRADETFQLLPQTIAAFRALRIDERGLKCIFDDWPWDRRRRLHKWPQLTRRLKEIVLAAGLAREDELMRLKCFHRWRKTFASFVSAASGKAIASEMLGHSCLSVTLAYLDPRITGERKLVGVLPDLLAEAPTMPSMAMPTPPTAVLANAIAAFEALHGVKVTVAGTPRQEGGAA